MLPFVELVRAFSLSLYVRTAPAWSINCICVLTAIVADYADTEFGHEEGAFDLFPYPRRAGIGGGRGLTRSCWTKAVTFFR